MGHIDLARMGSLTDDLNDLREAYPISYVVEVFTTVRRNANGGTACCPFHDDRDPSFSIYGDDKKFRCFGCGAHGDIFDYLQQMYGISFSGAVMMLQNGDIPIPVPTCIEGSDNADRVNRRPNGTHYRRAKGDHLAALRSG
jgi:DNA primase